MTTDGWLKLFETLALVVPSFVEAMLRVIDGHPSAQRVNDILPERGASDLVADELRR